MATVLREKAQMCSIRWHRGRELVRFIHHGSHLRHASTPQSKAPHLHAIPVRALADTEGPQLCIALHVALQPHLDEVQKHDVVTADGTKRVCPSLRGTGRS